jgi:hypothetical protein
MTDVSTIRATWGGGLIPLDNQCFAEFNNQDFRRGKKAQIPKGFGLRCSPLMARLKQYNGVESRFLTGCLSWQKISKSRRQIRIADYSRAAIKDLDLKGTVRPSTPKNDND